jgi:two-component system KDP operon response regulator KdpE
MSEGRILVVDDEPQIHRFLKPALSAAGYDALQAFTAAEAERLAATSAPDVIILDLGLPDKDGKEVIRSLRTWSKLPIIVLSARGVEAEKIEALDLGADDYVEKPFGIGELLARIRTAIRHREPATVSMSRFDIGDLSIDLAKRIVSRGGERVHLTPKEYDLLAHMARHAGLVMSPYGARPIPRTCTISGSSSGNSAPRSNAIRRRPTSSAPSPASAIASPSEGSGTLLVLQKIV